MDEAYDLGATVVRFIAGKDPGDAKREEAKKLLVDSLRQIMDYAKAEGKMDFTLKVFDRDIDKKSLIGLFSDALDVAKALRPDFPNFGLLADLSHFPLLRERPEDAIALVKDYLDLGPARQLRGGRSVPSAATATFSRDSAPPAARSTRRRSRTTSAS